MTRLGAAANFKGKKRRALRARGLHMPLLSQRHDLAARDDHVIEQAHVDQLQGLLELPGELDVGRAGAGQATRMRMPNEDGGGIQFQSALDDFAGIVTCSYFSHHRDLESSFGW